MTGHASTGRTPSLPGLAGLALLIGGLLLAGCGSDERTVKTTTTEQTVVQPPAPLAPPGTSTTTTTITREPLQ
jgi:hypothetical protein